MKKEELSFSEAMFAESSRFFDEDYDAVEETETKEVIEESVIVEDAIDPFLSTNHLLMDYSEYMDAVISEGEEKKEKTIEISVKKTEYDEYRISYKIDGKDNEDKAGYVEIRKGEPDEKDQLADLKGQLKDAIAWAEKNGKCVIAASAKKFL
jgi:hypothetical protein